MGGCCGEQKVTVMVLSVDLQCCQCYRKVKKLLCKFPQIRNQVYDEKQNTVTITVVCCSPERIRDKLCAKGGKTIKSIEIKEPKKPDPKSKPQANDKAETEQKPKNEPKKVSKNGCESKPNPSGPDPKPKQDEKAPPLPCLPGPPCCGSCYEGISGGPCYQAGWRKPEKQATPAPAPPKQPDPVPVCCDSCYEGIPGGPCYQGGYGYSYGRPPCQSGFGYGYWYRYNAYGSRCDYFCEENPSACSIM